MMGVIPAWRLAEMFELPDIVSLLERSAEQVTEEELERAAESIAQLDLGEGEKC
jgi:hypothetical protein